MADRSPLATPRSGAGLPHNGVDGGEMKVLCSTTPMEGDRDHYLEPCPPSLRGDRGPAATDVEPIRPEIPGDSAAVLPEWSAALGTRPVVYLSLGTVPWCSYLKEPISTSTPTLVSGSASPASCAARRARPPRFETPSWRSSAQKAPSEQRLTASPPRSRRCPRRHRSRKTFASRPTDVVTAIDTVDLRVDEFPCRPSSPLV